MVSGTRTFITDYPTEVSPLSKARPDDPTTTERFELFVAGIELANGFSELNNPLEQRDRFAQQLAERDKGDDEAHRMDDDYVRALGHGLPPDGRRRRRHRPAHDGPDRLFVDPRRDPLPPHAGRSGETGEQSVERAARAAGGVATGGFRGEPTAVRTISSVPPLR